MYYKPTTLDVEIEISDIYTVHYFEYHKDFEFSGERHDFYELMYVDRGEIAVCCDERTFVLKENQLVVFSPNQFHALKADNKIAPNTIIVSFACTSDALEDFRDKVYYINDYQRSLLAGILREAKNSFSTNLSDPEYRKLTKRASSPIASQQMILCYLQLLIIELLRECGYKNTGKSSVLRNEYDKKFRVLANWIDKNIDKSFTVKDLCAEAMTNTKTLESIFRQCSGMSAIDYCRKRKTEYAKRLLREDTFNISQISEKLGFSSVHYFSRTFKSIENMTPTEYANSAKAIIDHSKNVMKNS